MLEKNDAALKEWAAIIGALERGVQTILLRKGGIAEREGEFELIHREFFLFPTYTHQEERGQASDRPSDDLRLISSYAVASDFLFLRELALVERLAPFHLWSPEVIRERFSFGGEQGLHLLVLRVFRLPEKRTLPNLSSYRGCVSWVKLVEPLSTTGAEPVLSDEDFASARNSILGAVA